MFVAYMHLIFEVKKKELMQITLTRLLKVCCNYSSMNIYCLKYGKEDARKKESLESMPQNEYS